MKGWLSRDPIKDAEQTVGPNLYDYCSNEPINEIDALGLEKGDKGDCDWTFTVTGSRSDTNPMVMAHYQATSQEQKCCKTFSIQRRATWLIKGMAGDPDGPDGPDGPDSANGYDSSDEDEPGFYNPFTGNPIHWAYAKITFTWIVHCKAGAGGACQGKNIAEITKVYRVHDGKGTLSNQ